MVEEHNETPVTLRTHKLWQVLDDCIKTKRYVQMAHNYREQGTNKRCMMGVFMEYGGLSEGGPDDIVRVSSKFSDNYGVPYNYGKQEVIDELKGYYAFHKRIEHDFVVKLNDTFGVTFEEFRDLFKEMDV